MTLNFSASKTAWWQHAKLCFICRIIQTLIQRFNIFQLLWSTRIWCRGKWAFKSKELGLKTWVKA